MDYAVILSDIKAGLQMIAQQANAILDAPDVQLSETHRLWIGFILQFAEMLIANVVELQRFYQEALASGDQARIAAEPRLQRHALVHMTSPINNMYNTCFFLIDDTLEPEQPLSDAVKRQLNDIQQRADSLIVLIDKVRDSAADM